MPLADGLVPWLFLPASFSWQLWLYFLGVAWLLVWGGHFLLRQAAPRYDRRPWPWPRLVGLVLVLFPFVRITYNLLVSIPDVIETGTVARTVPASAWWRSVRRNMTMNLVVPLLGLLLASGLATRLRSGGVAGLARRVIAGVGMWPRHSWTRDAAVGCGLAVVVFFGYIGLAMLLAPLSERDTGDASRVFLQITLPLAFALAIMAGLTEEFLYRGLLVVRLGRLLPQVPAVVFVLPAAMVFGLAHAGYGTIANILFPFFFGLAMGFLVLWVGVWPAVIVHFFVNLMIFLSILIGAEHPHAAAAMDATFLLFVAFPALYFGLLLIGRLTRSKRAPSERPPAAPGGNATPSRPVPVAPRNGRNA